MPASGLVEERVNICVGDGLRLKYSSHTCKYLFATDYLLVYRVDHILDSFSESLWVVWVKAKSKSKLGTGFDFISFFVFGDEA